MKTREVRKVAADLEKPVGPWTLRRARQRFERAYVDDAVRHCDGDLAKIAKLLGISRSSLKEKRQLGYGGRR